MADRAGSGAVGAEPPRAPAARRMARGERGRPVEESRWPRRNGDARREVGDLGATAKFAPERPSGESRRPGTPSSASASTRALRNEWRGSAPTDAACLSVSVASGARAGSGAGAAWRRDRGRAAPRPVVERSRRKDWFEARCRAFPERGVIGDARCLSAAPPPPGGIVRRRGGRGTPDGEVAENAALPVGPDRNPGGPRA